jgi:hypothetical protein
MSRLANVAVLGKLFREPFVCSLALLFLFFFLDRDCWRLFFLFLSLFIFFFYLVSCLKSSRIEKLKIP